MRAIMLVALSGLLLLSSCASYRRCAGTPAYQKEDSLPAPAPVEGLTIPDSPSALRIPPPPADPAPYGKKVKDPRGGSMYECLDVPPTLNPPPPPAAGSTNPPKS